MAEVIAFPARRRPKYLQWWRRLVRATAARGCVYLMRSRSTRYVVQHRRRPRPPENQVLAFRPKRLDPLAEERFNVRELARRRNADCATRALGCSVFSGMESPINRRKG